MSELANTLLRWTNVPGGVGEVISDLRHANPGRFQVDDLVQVKSEYVVHGNPSLFRIREIVDGRALLGQLSSEEDGFIGTDTWVDLDDPELIAPYPEILQRYARHVR